MGAWSKILHDAILTDGSSRVTTQTGTEKGCIVYLVTLSGRGSDGKIVKWLKEIFKDFGKL